MSKPFALYMANTQVQNRLAGSGHREGRYKKTAGISIVIAGLVSGIMIYAGYF